MAWPQGRIYGPEARSLWVQLLCCLEWQEVLPASSGAGAGDTCLPGCGTRRAPSLMGNQMDILSGVPHSAEALAAWPEAAGEHLWARALQRRCCSDLGIHRCGNGAGELLGAPRGSLPSSLFPSMCPAPGRAAGPRPPSSGSAVMWMKGKATAGVVR